MSPAKRCLRLGVSALSLLPGLAAAAADLRLAARQLAGGNVNIV